MFKFCFLLTLLIASSCAIYNDLVGTWSDNFDRTIYICSKRHTNSVSMGISLPGPANSLKTAEFGLSKIVRGEQYVTLSGSTYKFRYPIEAQPFYLTYQSPMQFDHSLGNHTFSQSWVGKIGNQVWIVTNRSSTLEPSKGLCFETTEEDATMEGVWNRTDLPNNIITVDAFCSDATAAYEPQSPGLTANRTFVGYWLDNKKIFIGAGERDFIANVTPANFPQYTGQFFILVSPNNAIGHWCNLQGNDTLARTCTYASQENYIRVPSIYNNASSDERYTRLGCPLGRTNRRTANINSIIGTWLDTNNRIIEVCPLKLEPDSTNQQNSQETLLILFYQQINASTEYQYLGLRRLEQYSYAIMSHPYRRVTRYFQQPRLTGTITDLSTGRDLAYLSMNRTEIGLWSGVTDAEDYSFNFRISSSLPDVCKFNILPNDNVAVKWSSLHLGFIKQAFSFLTPNRVGRNVAKINTCIYDAWALYDKKASTSIYKPSTALKNFINNLSHDERVRQQEEAISQSARCCLLNTYTEDLIGLNRANRIQSQTNDFLIKHFGLVPSDSNVCQAVTEKFLNDGFNELGNLPGTATDGPGSDYTGYRPINDPADLTGQNVCAKLRSINHWQPLLGQRMFEPHMGHVKGFALENIEDYLLPGPPLFGTNIESEFLQQHNEVLLYSQNLDDLGKAISWYWLNGPNDNHPSGHLQEISIIAIRRKELSLGDSTKLLFMQGNAGFDAGIAVWYNKRYYNSARPISVINCLFENVTIEAWRGPYLGVGPINGSLWRPYQFSDFVTPPFPEYPSGHSAFSTASAEVLRRFFGSDEFHYTFTVKEGSLPFEPKIVNGTLGWIANVTDVPNQGPTTVGYAPGKDVTLRWTSFSQMAEESGISRLYGGVHITSGNTDALALGYKIGSLVYEKAKKLFN